MKKLFFLVALLVALPTFAIDLGEYKYYPRKKLGKNLEKVYQKHMKKARRSGVQKPLKVKVVDELVKIWDKQPLQGGWIRFDTKYFRCVIRRSTSGVDSETGFPKGYDLIRQIQKYRKEVETADKMKKTMRNDKEYWKHYGLIAIYGRVEKSSLWGQVKRGKSDGVEPEHTVLIVEDIQVPRKRFLELYKKK